MWCTNILHSSIRSLDVLEVMYAFPLFTPTDFCFSTKIRNPHTPLLSRRVSDSVFTPRQRGRAVRTWAYGVEETAWALQAAIVCSCTATAVTDCQGDKQCCQDGQVTPQPTFFHPNRRVKQTPSAYKPLPIPQHLHWPSRPPGTQPQPNGPGHTMKER